MSEKKSGPQRTMLLIILVVAGVALSILPHWLRSGKRSLQPLVLEATGRHYPDSTPVDSLGILFRLATVTDPDLNLNIIEVGLLETLAIDTSAHVRVILGLTTPYCPYIQELAQTVLDTLISTPGVKKATVKLDPNLIRGRR
ncbi:MAG: metal-sulfur cluster assembly factor [bacterium]